MNIFLEFGGNETIIERCDSTLITKRLRIIVIEELWKLSINPIFFDSVHTDLSHNPGEYILVWNSDCVKVFETIEMKNVGRIWTSTFKILELKFILCGKKSDELTNVEKIYTEKDMELHKQKYNDVIESIQKDLKQLRMTLDTQICAQQPTINVNYNQNKSPKSITYKPSGDGYDNVRIELASFDRTKLKSIPKK